MMLTQVAGMNRRTGRWLYGVDHVRQSILDVLTTPLGTRVCNRSYGSDLPDLIDAPLNEAGVQALYAATAVAISTWYPFVTLDQIAVETGETPGTTLLSLTGTETGTDGTNPFTLSLPLSPQTLN
jgi:uncharacterized protein